MATGSPRKLSKAKRALPSLPPESPRLKSVTFNDEVVETSIGGTQSVGRIKQDVLLNFEPSLTRFKLSSSNTTNSSKGSRSSSSSQCGKENKEIIQDDSVETSISSTEQKQLNDETKTSSGTVTPRSQPSPRKGVKPVPNSGKKVEYDINGRISNRESAEGSSTDQSKKKKESLLNVDESNNAKTPRDSLSKPDSSGRSVSSSSNSESDRMPEVKEDRRTTLEQINETIGQSPFRTPTANQSRRHTLESRIFSTPDCYRDVTAGTPRRMLPLIQDESMDIEGEEGEDSCSIVVAVRVRPFVTREMTEANPRCVVEMCDNTTTVTSDTGATHHFAYDFSFWSHDPASALFCDQEAVYTRLAQPLLAKAFEGYNTCLFAYGQTGSGKSYCIMGHGNESGIIPRFCEELFVKAESLASRQKVKVNVEVSFFEIYNEKIHDLLAGSKDKGTKKATLKVREHPVLGPYVEGLSTYVVNSFEDIEGWITLGNKNRATAATGMNDKSSRSHSVFTLVLTQTKTETLEGQEHDHSINSKISLVDLAGSERQTLAKTSGERLREGANINKSLLTLGKVISLLSERSVTKKRKIFIPYRDSVLTWLLKESLGGNSKTAMIATVSPSSQHIEETLSTLRYAQQARSIVNVVRINEDPKAKIIRQLRAEIDRLRMEQGGGLMNEEALASSMAEIAKLKSEMEEMSRSWQERLRQAEARKAEELKTLERAGITFKVDNTLPNLVNLNEDPQLSEMLLYVIREGETRVGRQIDAARHDIQLTGALIADNHCMINNVNGVVDITPLGDAPTYVNGDLIAEKTTLRHADRVILGGDHYFRFNHPMEVKKAKGENSQRSSSEIKDYDFAKQELHRVQEARLQAELEEELARTRQELTQQKNGYEDKLKGLEKVLTKVEETQKEAQNTIHSLKKQNMMLEQEVLAGRKRQKQESSQLQQALEDGTLSKSRIMELLESEKKQTLDRLEKLRAKRMEMVTPSRIAHDSLSQTSPSSRRDLYKIALLLREANKINQYLGTSLMFSREDVCEEGDKNHTQIRVTNTKHRMFTTWTVAKFEERLAQMRDLYQNEDDASADDDEVFNDSEDVWEKDTSIISSPAITQTNGVRPSSRGPVLNRLGSSLKKELYLSGSPVVSTQRSSSTSGDHSAVRECKNLLASVGDALTAVSFEESVADKVLNTCQRIQDSVVMVTKDTACGQGPLLHLTVAVHLLASHTTLWSALHNSLNSSLLRDLVARSADQVKAIGHHATALLQGWEGQLTSLVTESVHKLTSGLQSLCVTSGQLALASDCPVMALDSELSAAVCHSFLEGCGQFVERTLTGAVSSVEASQQKCSKWKDELEGESPSSQDGNLKDLPLQGHVAHLLSCAYALMQAALLIQRALNSDPSDLRPPQYHSATYKRLQGIVGHVSAVVDSCTLLVESSEPVVKGEVVGEGRRLERCAELIQRSSQRLVSASSASYTVPGTPTPSTHSMSDTVFSTPSTPGNTSATHVMASVSSTSASTDVTSSSSLTSVSDTTDTSKHEAHNRLTSTMISSHENSKGSNSTSSAVTTELYLLSDSQLGQLDAACKEVELAASIFVEYVTKNWPARVALSSTRTLMTPRGKRILPASPEKVVVTPAVNAAHLRKLNTKRTLALAEQQESS